MSEKKISVYCNNNYSKQILLKIFKFNQTLFTTINFFFQYPLRNI